jgi:divalent metal cation (Fe/Co/Zn/Cd) transporter
LTFPTGRFVPRWSWLVLLCWIITFVWNSPPTFQAQILQAATTLVVYGGTLFIMVYRYVRVFDVTQRQQAKWFVYATVVSLSLFVLGTGLPGVVPADSPSQLLFPTIILFSSAFFYLGLGFAILRYRIWDIDAVINRTLVYGSLTTLLALLYVGLIVALQALFQGVFNQNNDVAIVVSTLVIAALFQPLRHRLQQIIDRRFYRRKYDAARTLVAFSATLRSEVDLSQLGEQLVAVVQETMQPAHVSLWLRPPAQDRNHQVI